MRTWFAVHTALLILVLSYPDPSYDQSLRLLAGDEPPAGQKPHAGSRTDTGRESTQAGPSKEPPQDSEYRPARGIQKFTEPTILLKGTADEIGLDSRTLASFLGSQFLEDFAFLQGDFAFAKTYETWEIGLFECEAWTVGRNYPIAFHVECSGGSMDAPRHWNYATLGYGPKDKIVEMVRKTLDSIVAEYAAFVRKARVNQSMTALPSETKPGSIRPLLPPAAPLE
jgi:hypothetical protein